MIDGTISKKEVAKALGKSVHEFDSVVAAMFALDFPRPVGANEHWRIADLLEWVTMQQEVHLTFVDTLSRFIRADY